METGDRIRMVERMREENGEGPLLSVRNLVKSFPVKHGILARTKGEIRAVNDVSFDIARGETLSLVGESGCGKTTTAKLVLGLEEPTGGGIRFEGRDLNALDTAGRRQYRRSVQAVFQDPYASLNPRMAAGRIVSEPLENYSDIAAKEREARVAELFAKVGLRADAMRRFPFEFSGGQRQRLGIARALALNPRLIVADEPVSALDVSVQAQVLRLLADIRDRLDLTMLFITHDLRVAAQVCDTIAVMHDGEIVEYGPTSRIYSEPQHAYTKSLLAAVPGRHWHPPVIPTIQ